MKKNINIVAPNIKTGGGKELLEYLIEYVLQCREDISMTVYLDKSMSHIQSSLQLNVVHLDANSSKIKLFSEKMENTIYFGNLPPFRKSINSVVYMHNPYLLMELSELKNSSFKFFLKYSLQQLYIRAFIRKVDIVACQNNVIRKAFINKYKFRRVELLPFFRLCERSLISGDKKEFDFCYVSLAHPHKNHQVLLSALGVLTDRNVKCRFALTIEEGRNDLLDKIDIINKRNVVEIKNFGYLAKADVCKLYSQSKALVFPSAQETFGLPLLEAAEMGLDVIAANLDYVYQSIEPTLVFDHKSPNDIADKLIDYLKAESTDNRSVSKIKNKVNELINIVVET